MRLLAETKRFQQNGIHETAETNFAKLSRNAKTAKPIKIAKLPKLVETVSAFRQYFLYDLIRVSAFKLIYKALGL